MNPSDGRVDKTVKRRSNKIKIMSLMFMSLTEMMATPLLLCWIASFVLRHQRADVNRAIAACRALTLVERAIQAFWALPRDLTRSLTKAQLQLTAAERALQTELAFLSHNCGQRFYFDRFTWLREQPLRENWEKEWRNCADLFQQDVERLLNTIGLQQQFLVFLGLRKLATAFDELAQICRWPLGIFIRDAVQSAQWRPDFEPPKK